MADEQRTYLRSIICQDVIDPGHDIDNILVCWAKYLENVLQVSLLVILKLQIPKWKELN